MLSYEAEEILGEYLVSKVEETNSKILQTIGETIKTMSTLTPSQAFKLQQILKYGGTYESIARELAILSGKNVQDIYKIFEKIAKDNKDFAKQFYEYRNMNYIPYEQDLALKNQVDSIAKATAQTYLNISQTRGIGFLFEDIKGNFYFKNIEQGYYEIIDRGIMAISQGKETFQSEMRKIINDVGGNGVVLYESGRTRRLDSALRMNIMDGIRQVNNETNLRFGEQYGADGVEISVHSNPAPDHADIQGRQFRKEQYDLLEDGYEAKDYKGNIYNGAEKRRISEYNCYHRVRPIILGVVKPEYSDEELQKIKTENTKGFRYNGKHYTMYEGTQLQRRLELEIRKAKDKQIMATSSGDKFKDVAIKNEKRVRQLTEKYNELCNISGLSPQKQRMAVPKYRRIAV